MILLTGGCGFIGSHICVELLKRKHEVVIIDYRNDATEIGKNILHTVNYDTKTEPLLNNKLTIYKYDLQNKAKLDLVFKTHKIDTVIHLAALKSVGDSVKQPGC